MYVRQEWVDQRLAVDGPNFSYTLDHHHVDQLWVPDLFFYNLKDSTFHDVMVPNMVFRMQTDGTVGYSRR